MLLFSCFSFGYGDSSRITHTVLRIISRIEFIVLLLEEHVPFNVLFILELTIRVVITQFCIAMVSMSDCSYFQGSNI